MAGADLHGEAFRMLQVKGLDQSVVDEAESGETMLLATGAILDGTSNELLIPAGAQVEVSRKCVTDKFRIPSWLLFSELSY